MQRFFNKQFNKKAAPILLSLTAVFLVVPHQAHAVTVGGVLGNLVGGADWLLGITGPLFEILILPFAATIMALAGNLMDTAINFGLHTAYIFSLSPAINMGWVIIRDLANILFIFILIYISLGTIVKASGFQTKKLLTQVIIAALLVNFSMFFTKAIIDVSNVFGNWLYGGIQKTLAVNSVGNPPPGSDQAVSLSGLIADRLGIAKYWASGGQTIDQSKTSSQSSSFSNSLIRLMVVLIATYIFAYCAILFMARSIELLILLVFAPIGFVGGLLPQTSKYSKEWWDELLSVAIFPVAFLLMLYIAMQFINSLSSIQGQLASMASPLEIAGFPIMTYFQYFLIIFLLQACLKIAKDNSGEMGKALGGLAGQLGKLAVGAAAGIGTGGAALVGRQIVGRVASRVAQNEGFQAFAGRSWLGEQALKGTRGIAGSSFDLRGTSLFKGTVGQAVEGVGEGGGKGGFEKHFEDKTKAREEFGKSLYNSGKDRYGNPITISGMPAGTTARGAYVERLRGGIFRGGLASKLPGTPSVMSTVLGRTDRVAGAKMVNGLLAERKAELSALTSEQNQLRGIVANGGALTPYQDNRLNASNPTLGPTIAQDIADATTEFQRLQGVANEYTKVSGRTVKARGVEKTKY